MARSWKRCGTVVQKGPMSPPVTVTLEVPGSTVALARHSAQLPTRHRDDCRFSTSSGCVNQHRKGTLTDEAPALMVVPPRLAPHAPTDIHAEVSIAPSWVFHSNRPPGL